MNIANRFSAEMSPQITVIDPAGVSRPVARIEDLVGAMKLADQIYALGGNGAVVNVHDNPIPSQAWFPAPFMIYYRPEGEARAKRAEIAGIANTISRSTLRDAFDGQGLDATIRPVGGTRAVGYAHHANAKNGAACFLVSKTVWYNQNRATIFGERKDEVELVIADMQQRLEIAGIRGKLSALR